MSVIHMCTNLILVCQYLTYMTLKFFLLFDTSQIIGLKRLFIFVLIIFIFIYILVLSIINIYTY